MQFSLAAMLLLVACTAVNFWLFRVGMLWGLLGLYVSKHVVIAYLCHVVGLNRTEKARAAAIAEIRPGPMPH